MTKALHRVALAALATLALVLLPAVQAHGAPGSRSIDTRTLLDDDGVLGYGGGGLDVLALDVREAYLADGAPAVVFRFVVQSDAAPAGQTLALSMEAAGKATTLTVATADGTAYTSQDFDGVDGPFDVGDGHPKAIDAWIRHEALGIAAGDTITGLAVASVKDGALDDVMPGGWFLQGQEVPAVAAPGADAAPAGEYTVAGPAALLTIVATPVAAAAPASVTLRLANPTDLAQFTNLSLVVPAGVSARLEQAAVGLDGNGSREVSLLLGNATADGIVQVVASTDLGGRAVIQVPVTAPAAAPPTNATADHHDETEHADEDSKDTPTPVLAVPALALALLLSRRLAR